MDDKKYFMINEFIRQNVGGEIYFVSLFVPPTKEALSGTISGH